MIKTFVQYVFLLLILVFTQVFLFNNIEFSGFVNPYVYIMLIILLPFNVQQWVVLVVSFLIGLLVDLFTFTYGMHMISTVLIAYLRPLIFRNIAPRDGYQVNSSPRIYYYGLRWFLLYTAIMVFIHHFVLFYIEIFRFSDFFHVLFRVFMSTIFTTTIIVLSQYFVFRK